MPRVLNGQFSEVSKFRPKPARTFVCASNPNQIFAPDLCLDSCRRLGLDVLTISTRLLTKFSSEFLGGFRHSRRRIRRRIRRVTWAGGHRNRPLRGLPLSGLPSQFLGTIPTQQDLVASCKPVSPLTPPCHPSSSIGIRLICRRTKICVVSIWQISSGTKK